MRSRALHGEAIINLRNARGCLGSRIGSHTDLRPAQNLRRRSPDNFTDLSGSLHHVAVGAAVGAGRPVGAEVGAAVGAELGAAVGAEVGAAVGARVGADVGADVGAPVGAETGLTDGAANTEFGTFTANIIGATQAAAFATSRLLTLGSCSAASAICSR